MRLRIFEAFPIMDSMNFFRVSVVSAGMKGFRGTGRN